MFRTRLAVLAAVVASFALMAAPAAGLAKAPVKFGAKLDPTVQPSNSLPGLPCSQESLVQCTMVQNEAYGRPDGGELAPKSGTIKKIRLIAGGPGVWLWAETAIPVPPLTRRLGNADGKTVGSVRVSS